MTLDHTLTWEVARVGGMLAYVMVTASVAIGLLLSLKATSENWPRFITNELHRFVTLVALVFTGVHTLAVLVDPFTGSSLAEVFVPLTTHYRPLWIAMGIVSAYVLVAVWASEYVRKRIGYAWWRRFHYLAFAVFLLGTLHGLGTGSDSVQPWALALSAACGGLVTLLLAARIVQAIPHRRGDVAVFAVGAGFLAFAAFAIVGPAQPGWNNFANNGNGSGASAAWLAANPAPAAADSAPTASFDADLVATLVDDEQLRGTFSGDGAGAAGTLQLAIDEESVVLELDFADGWTCRGQASVGAPGSLAGSCSAPDGLTIAVTLTDLERRSDGSIIGSLEVDPGSG
jgi:DMSO/TMAO reductase YedYZ heme-binding membrane subunit